MASQAKAAPLNRTKKLAKTPSSPSPAPAATAPLPPAEPEQKTNFPPIDSTQSINSATSGEKIRNHLDHLATRFDGFEDELNLSRNKKKADEDRRILILQTQLNQLQASLALESKNRAMSVKALQNWLTDRISQWTEQIEAPMITRLNTLSDQITFLSQRIDQVEAKQKEDREIFPKLVDGRCEELLREISGLKSQFQANLLTREEKEKKILLKLQNESNKLAVQFSQDKLIVDEKVQQLRTAIDDEVAIRAKGAEMVKATLLEEVALLKAEIAQEKKDRETADEDLVQAINHYSAALQDGIKIVLHAVAPYARLFLALSDIRSQIHNSAFS